jgi:hypothetical protein
MKAMKLTMLVTVWVGLAMVTTLYAEDSAEAPAMPVEVKKTVDSLAGHWIFDGSDTEPGAKQSAKVTMVIDCKPAALGAAVACTLVGQIAGIGPVEAASVVGYSPDERLVHWMEISSTREYHDHKGPWKENAVEFEPLPYTISGRKNIENFRISFPSPGILVLRAVTQTPDGRSILEGTAKRE